MADQRITCIALPNGRAADGRLRLTAVINVRLTPDFPGQTLAAFPDFLNFGTVALRTQYEATFSNGEKVAATPDPGSPQPDNAVWTALFKGSLAAGVRKYDNFAGRKIRSYPAANIAAGVKAIYADVAAASPTTFPTTTRLLDDLGLRRISADPLEDQLTRAKTQLETQFGQAQTLPARAFSSADFHLDIAQTSRFYEPQVSNRAAIVVPEFTFADALAALASQPQLLRKLGLIRDLLLPAPAGLDNLQWVSLNATWTPEPDPNGGGGGGSGDPSDPSGSPDIPGVSSRRPSRRLPAVTTTSPRTSLLGGPFIAAPRSVSPSLDGRVLRLSDPKYAVLDLDVDSAAMQNISAATAVATQTHPSRRGPSTPQAHALPALATDGISLVESGRANNLSGRLQRQGALHQAIESNAPPQFSAEDLVRGYHIDIYDVEKRAWFPLCFRNVTYRFTNGLTLSFEDEAAVTLAATSSLNPEKKDVFLGETVMTWTGWSLVTPRPGKALDPDDDKLLQPKPDTSNVGTIPLGIETTTPKAATRAKLPSLRVGHSYRIRARAVDIGGNSDAFDANAPLTNSTEVHTFRRYEPVPPPVVVPREESTPGSSVRRLVIRSDVDEPPGFASTTSRHIAPPNTSQLRAEIYGDLDRDGRIDRGLYAMLAARDGQLLDQSPVNGKALDPHSPTNAAGAGEYYFPAEFVQIPYLPDSFSTGMSLSRLPFGRTNIAGIPSPGGSFQLEWGRSGAGFETVLAHRITLAEPTATSKPSDVAPQAQMEANGQGELLLFLPKGSVARVRLSSTMTRVLDEQTGRMDVDRMALWSWLQERMQATGTSDDAQRAMRVAIARGFHWMFTPFLELELVHAVRRPLLAPRWALTQGRSGPVARLFIGRTEGDTAATLSGTLSASGRSTSRITVRAAWNETLDEVSLPAPTTITGADRPCGITVIGEDFPIATPDGRALAPALDPFDFRALRHDFPDHKYRRVRYSLEAVSRFAEEFTETAVVTFTATRTSALAAAALVEGYTTVIDPREQDDQKGTSFAPDVDFVVNSPEEGMISLPAGSEVPLGVPLQVRYLVAPVTRISGESSVPDAAARTAVVDVLATKRPATPEVRYLIPAFTWSGWKKSAKSNNIEANSREGNTLRVWLDRPWFSSGDGEQLAVILPQGGQPDAHDPADMEEKVTLVGADPIWGTERWGISRPESGPPLSSSGPSTKVLRPGDFPLAKRRIDGGLRVPGIPRGVAAAVHDVAFDPERRQWFCDIEISPGSEAYTPFVRLVMARYQHHALVQSNQEQVVDLRCSTVVQADVAQLLPDRGITVFKDPGKNTARVVVEGLSYLSIGQKASSLPRSPDISARKGPSRVELIVQTTHPLMSASDFPDTAWQSKAGPIVMTGTIKDSGQARWEGVVPLPQKLGKAPMRLVVTEYEEHHNVDLPRPEKGRVVFTATYTL